MSLFDVYIAIDFSGSKDSGRQKSSIALAEVVRGKEPDIHQNRFTRFDVVLFLLQRIFHHNNEARRVLCGFDFSYAFPCGFWSTLTGQSESWEEVIRGLAEGTPQLPAIVEKPEPNARDWAQAANKKLAHSLRTGIGPFWGPGFSQSKDPHFPYSRTPFKEYRLVEQKKAGFKPIYKIGGQGSVGLQSLCGMPYIYNLRTTCIQQKVNLNCWPFDGWQTDSSAHCLLEFYPALFNEGGKSHAADALACAKWAMEQDSRGELLKYFNPNLTEAEREKAAIEGWVLGIL